MSKLPKYQENCTSVQGELGRDYTIELGATQDNTIAPSSQRSQLKPLVNEALQLESPGEDAGNAEFEEDTIQQARDPDTEAAATEQLQVPARIPTNLALRLYTSHFLSTWNSRLFEFGVVLFLASIFPGTLLPISVYALVRSGAAIVFARALGTWIDRGDRLVVVRMSIIGQRLAVAASCGLFWALERQRAVMGERLKDSLFALSVVLACVEKLCSVTNLVSIERDWVVVITAGDDSIRRVMNARMRRIDLFCKLSAPLTISLIAIASTLIAIRVTLAMNVASVLIEYLFIAQVYNKFPALRRNLAPALDDQQSQGATFNREPDQPTPKRAAILQRLKTTAYSILPISSISFYFQHDAFLPSFSLSLLYFTVLSFSGQMITYLISVGYTSAYVGITRTVSSVFELSATWIAPFMMKRIGVIRGGIWSLSWQMAWLAAGMSWFFADFHHLGKESVIKATGLAVGVALSRVGLWGYDLCAQNIIQDEVDGAHRGMFSTTEFAFQNLFELLSYTSTIIFSRPDQFKWPVVVSISAVYLAGGLYAFFVRRRRGHLFHAPPCMSRKQLGTVTVANG